MPDSAGGGMDKCALARLDVGGVDEGLPGVQECEREYCGGLVVKVEWLQGKVTRGRCDELGVCAGRVRKAWHPNTPSPGEKRVTPGHVSSTISETSKPNTNGGMASVANCLRARVFQSWLTQQPSNAPDDCSRVWICRSTGSLRRPDLAPRVHPGSTYSLPLGCRRTPIDEHSTRRSSHHLVSPRLDSCLEKTKIWEFDAGCPLKVEEPRRWSGRRNKVGVL